MTEHVAFVPGEVVDVDTVKPGDEILIGRRKGYHLVSAVERYDDGSIVVCYFDNDQASYENRARDKSGANAQRILCEKSIAAARAGDEVTVIRGSTGAAKTMRAKMEREMQERLGKKQWGGFRR